MYQRWIVLIFIIASASLSGQNMAKNAIGLRLDGSDGIGPEISYQRALMNNNRLEVDLGFSERESYALIKFTALYQWVFPVEETGLNWYVGAGGGLGFVDFDNNSILEDGDEDLLLTADGMFGIEYSFRQAGVPILLSLDLNPELELLNDKFDDFDLDFALGIRYQF